VTSVSDCLFCQMATGAFPTDMLHQDSQLFAIRDINPRAPIHVLIIPRRHYSSARDLTLDQAPLLSHMITVANDLADQLDIGMRGYRLAFNVGDELRRLYDHYLREAQGQALLGAAGVVLLIALWLRSWRRLLAVCKPLLLAVLLTMAALAALGIPLGILHLVGLLLVGLLAGCGSTTPNQNPYMLTGAGLGAALGAGLGIAASPNNP